MSFPSGHSAAAFAGFGFLALYLNARLKIIGRHQASSPLSNTPSTPRHAQEEYIADQDKAVRTPNWKLLVWMLPWLVALLIAGSKVRDGWHHPIDVVFGAVVGTLFAHIAFGCVFRGVYDGRVNHLPRDGEENEEEKEREGKKEEGKEGV
jgi:diacylglycerol diphosphate phosphatase/phosphatidate phosphatase